MAKNHENTEVKNENPAVAPVENPQVNETVEDENKRIPAPKLKDLVVKIAFTDKYDESVDYKVGDVIKADSISKKRYDELLNDDRGMVEEVE